jgi:hypothetical protein
MLPANYYPLDIAVIELSVDGDETWNEGLSVPDQRARVAALAIHVRCSRSVGVDVVVRAVERDGTVLTREESSPRPSGATGWHRRVQV